MRRLFLTLACLACAGTAAWAQSDAPMPILQASVIPPAPVPVQQLQPGFSGHACASGNCPTAGCADGHCHGHKCPPVVCVMEPTKKVKVSVKYNSICTPVCTKRCPSLLSCIFGHGRDGCSSCGDPGAGCQHPWAGRTLVKRIVTEDIPTTRCVPVAATCDNGCGTWQSPSGPEPIPAPDRSRP